MNFCLKMLKTEDIVTSWKPKKMIPCIICETQRSIGCPQELRMPVFLTSVPTGSHFFLWPTGSYWFLSEDFLTGQSHGPHKRRPETRSDTLEEVKATFDAKSLIPSHTRLKSTTYCKVQCFPSTFHPLSIDIIHSALSPFQVEVRPYVHPATRFWVIDTSTVHTTTMALASLEYDKVSHLLSKGVQGRLENLWKLWEGHPQVPDQIWMFLNWPI